MHCTDDMKCMLFRSYMYHMYMSCTSWDFVKVITCTKSCTKFEKDFVQVITCTKIMLVQVITCTKIMLVQDYKL